MKKTKSISIIIMTLVTISLLTACSGSNTVQNQMNSIIGKWVQQSDIIEDNYQIEFLKDSSFTLTNEVRSLDLKGTYKLNDDNTLTLDYGNSKITSSFALGEDKFFTNFDPSFPKFMILTGGNISTLTGNWETIIKSDQFGDLIFSLTIKKDGSFNSNADLFNVDGYKTESVNIYGDWENNTKLQELSLYPKDGMESDLHLSYIKIGNSIVAISTMEKHIMTSGVFYRAE